MEDQDFMLRAVDLALEAERDGNLPVGSLLSLRGLVLSEGLSRVYQPHYDLTRHAEMEAIRALPVEYWEDPGRLTIYTTLEPCLMCLGAILLFGIGKVVFGAADSFGGARGMQDRLSPFFKARFEKIAWIGPILPEICDPLHARLRDIEQSRA